TPQTDPHAHAHAAAGSWSQCTRGLEDAATATAYRPLDVDRRFKLTHYPDLSHRNRDGTDMIMTQIREMWVGRPGGAPRAGRPGPLPGVGVPGAPGWGGSIRLHNR